MNQTQRVSERIPVLLFPVPRKANGKCPQGGMTSPLASLCEAAQCSPRSKYPWGAHWVVRRSVAEVSALRADGGIVTFGRTEPSAPTHVYRPCTLSLTCHSEGAKRPWESVPLFISTAALAATYLCRSAAKARFDNRQPPKGVSKEGGPQPSLFGRSRMGDFQGGRKIETSFPLNGAFGYFCRY